VAPPNKIDFAAVVGAEMWNRHRKNWRDVLDLLRVSQELATEIREIISQKSKMRSLSLEKSQLQREVSTTTESQPGAQSATVRSVGG
jgi:hypothetical protein